MRDITLVLDGAMGTELNKRGVQTKLPLWTAESNISHPFLVEQIHKEYIYRHTNNPPNIVPINEPDANPMKNIIDLNFLLPIASINARNNIAPQA